MKPLRHLVLAYAACVLNAAVQAAQLTYDIRVDAVTSSPGVTIVDAHNAIASGPGDVVGVLLYAVLANGDGDHSDEGVLMAQGSFVSTGGLAGDLRGDVAGQPATHVNNVAPFDSFLGQSGFQADLDSDGDLDVGSTQTTANDLQVLPWFIAVSSGGNSLQPIFGNGSGAGPTEFFIGRTTFTVAATAQAGQGTTVGFLPRVRIDGGTVATEAHRFVLDGASSALPGTSPHIATVGANIGIGATPVPQSPLAITGTATQITATTVTLNGSVNPNFSLATAKFQSGLTTAYGPDIPVQLLPANGGTPQALSATLAGLSPATTYHFHLVATSNLGTSDGGDVSFTTPSLSAPSVIAWPATNILATSAILQAAVTPNGGATTAIFQSGLTTAYGTDTPVTTVLGNGAIPKSVSVVLGGLTPNTTYHYRIVATNGAGTTTADDATFTTPAAQLPQVTAIVMDQPASFSATVSYLIDPRGSATSTVVQYGLTTAYGTESDAVVTPNSGLANSARTENILLTGLTPGTIYHYRLSATNLAGTVTTPDVTLRTLSPTLPAAVTYPATTIGATSATLNGGIGSYADQPPIAKFQYGPTIDYGFEVTVPVPSGGRTSAALTGLMPGTTYHYRMTATNIAGTRNGADMTFTTLAVDAPQPPYAGQTSAQLNTSTTGVGVQFLALMSPNGLPTTAKFQVGTTASYGTDVPVTLAPVDGTTLQQVKGSIPVQPNTTYHCRLVATNAAGTTNGDDTTFTTGGILNAPVIGPIVTSFTSTTTTLSSSINPSGSNTTVNLEYGFTTSYGKSQNIALSNPSGSATQPVSATLTGLTPNTTYHCRITAQNQIGTADTPDLAFTTPSVGPWLTYEMRIDPATSSSGVTVADAHHAVAGAAGEVVGVQIYAVVNSANGSHADDGFAMAEGSFVSTGALLGDLRGDVLGQPATQVNNVAPFNLGAGAVPVAQSGYQADIDGDGDLDVGSTVNKLTVQPWFAAFSNVPGATILGSGSGTGPTEFLIGRTTFTVGAGAQEGQGTTVHFIPLNRTDGVPAARIVHRFTLDGNALALQGNDPNIATVDANIVLVVPVPQPPVAITGSAANVTATSAVLNGTVNPQFKVTVAEFEAGLTTDYDEFDDLPEQVVPGDGGTAQAVSATLTGLRANTTYHFRLTAWNELGENDGADVTFTTLPPSPPVAATGTATSVLPTSVVLSGTVNSNGAVTTAKFQSGLTTDYGTDTLVWLPSANGADQTVTTKLTGLTPGTTYHYRISATNSAGTTDGDDATFTTPPAVPPLVTLFKPDLVRPTNVMFDCGMDPRGSPVTAIVQIGLTTDYGQNTVVPVPADNDTAPIFSEVTVMGLTPGTTYHCRLSVTNVGGTALSPDFVLVTAPPPEPYANTSSVANVTATSATLSAIVNPNGYATTATFHSGLTYNYGTDTPVVLSPDNGSVPQSVTATLTGLTPNTVYHFGFSATNANGTAQIGDKTFTTAASTPQPPIAITGPAVDIATNFAVLNATVGAVGDVTTARFESGLTTAYGTVTPATLVPNNSTQSQILLVQLGNLTPNTTYHYRIVATNSTGTTIGSDVAFTTQALLPEPQLTYEMRIDPATSSPGITVGDAHHAIARAPGDVVGVKIYAVMKNGDGDHSDDAFYQTQGSFLSAGTLHGDLRGDTLGQPSTWVNNVDPFKQTLFEQPLSQSGYQADLDGDGDLDVGSNFVTLTAKDNNGPAIPEGENHWFVANKGGPVAGSGAGTGPTEILIGQTTFTVGGDAQPGQETKVKYLSRVLVGNSLTKAINWFRIDGKLYTLEGFDANIAAVDASIVFAGPIQPPVAITGAAANVGATIATLNATVNPNGAATTAKFQSGLTDAYGTDTVVALAPNDGTEAQSVSTALTGLAPGMTYHFRIEAANSAGTADGADITFTTLADAIPPTIAVPAGGFQPLTLTTGADGTAALPDYTGQAVTDDNIGVTAVTQIPAPGAVPAGIVHVVLTAHDAAANTADAAFDVTVLDGTAPVITHAPDPVAVIADAGGMALVPDVTGNVTATDNVGVVSITQAPPAGASVSVGQTNIVLTVADAAGNTATTGVPFTVLAQAEPPADLGHGYYSGLLDDGAGSADGLVTLLVNGGGGFTGKASLHGVTQGFQGVFHGSAAQAGIPGLGKLSLARNAAGGIDLTLGVFAGHAENSPYTLLAPAPMRGSYTVLLPPDPAHTGDAAFPQGTGFATLKVNQLGMVRCVGRVGDSTPFAFDSSVHGDGALPCYDGLYTAPLGSIGGTLSFRDLAGSDLDGTLTWSKPAQNIRPGLFRVALVAGFGNLNVPAIGSLYQAAATPLQMLAYNNPHRAIVTFHDGGLAAPMSGTATVSAALSAFVTPPMRTLTFSPGDGTFVGTLRPSSATAAPKSFFGVVFQKQNRGAGLFMGTSTAGGFDYTPQP